MSHPENTYRALKDLPPFVDRWQCRVGWHRWGKWSDGERRGGDLYIYQHRDCVDCNKTELRKIGRNGW